MEYEVWDLLVGMLVVFAAVVAGLLVQQHKRELDHYEADKLEAAARIVVADIVDLAEQAYSIFGDLVEVEQLEVGNFEVDIHRRTALAVAVAGQADHIGKKAAADET